MKKLIIVAALALTTTLAHAQGSGQLQSGHIWGNPGATKAPATDSTVTSILDRAFTCSGQGSILMRGASAWTCKIPGTVALPLVSLGAGADLAYATLTVAGGGTGLNSGTSGGIPYFSASGTMASSAALTANRIMLGGGAGVAPTVLGSLGTTTTVLHGNAGGAPTFGAVSLSADVTGNLPLANIATGTQDTVLGYWGSTAVSAIAVNNCTGALTYSTATHTFGCNASAGTGNVVSSGTPTANQMAQWTNATTIQGVNIASVLTAGAGVSITGTTNATIAAALSSFTGVLGADVNMSSANTYFTGPTASNGAQSGLWYVYGVASIVDTSGVANLARCRLTDGTSVIASSPSMREATGATLAIQVVLAGTISSPAGNFRVECQTNVTTGVIKFNNSGESKDSLVTGFRIQ